MKLEINKIYKVKEGHEGKCSMYTAMNGAFIKIVRITTLKDYQYEILDKNKNVISDCCGCFTEDDLEIIEEEKDIDPITVMDFVKPEEKTLKQLIEEQKFDYVNSDITEENFPISKREHGEYKVYSFNKEMSSEDVIKEMEKDGYSPATLLELLEYKGDENYLIALSSVCGLDGLRHVPELWCRDNERSLRLYDWDGDWLSYYRFLSVRTLPIKSLESDPLPLKTLDNLEVGDEVIDTFGNILTVDNIEIEKTYNLSDDVSIIERKPSQLKEENYKLVKSLSLSEAETLLEEKLGYKVKIK